MAGRAGSDWQTGRPEERMHDACGAYVGELRIDCGSKNNQWRKDTQPAQRVRWHGMG